VSRAEHSVSRHAAHSSFRHVAPAGAPIRVTDLARWTAAAPRRDPRAALAQLFCERFRVGHAFGLSTGRAAMTVALRAMRRFGGNRDEVILPTYTCFSVAASVVKAGLKPRLVDIAPETLDFVPDALRRTDLRRVLAIVATNLYGLPNDLATITAIARPHNVFVIDDAAQAMGAAVDGRLCGTRGDAGLFSLDKGKNVSAIDGGMLVTGRDDLAAALREEIASLSAPSLATSIEGVAKALVYTALLRPSLYWIPERIPQLGLGKTVFTTEFPLERASRALAALGTVMMNRLDEFTRTRTANAAQLLDGLRAVPGLEHIAPIRGAEPVYLRLPLLVTDPATRDRLLAALRSAGIGATGSYPAALAEVSELRPLVAGPITSAPGGRYVAQRIVTLPTHAYVTAADVERIVRTVAEQLGTGTRTAPDDAALPPSKQTLSRKDPVCAE
jgi:perosamine synthetase